MLISTSCRILGRLSHHRRDPTTAARPSRPRSGSLPLLLAWPQRRSSGHPWRRGRAAAIGVKEQPSTLAQGSCSDGIRGAAAVLLLGGDEYVGCAELRPATRGMRAPPGRRSRPPSTRALSPVRSRNRVSQPRPHNPQCSLSRIGSYRPACVDLMPPPRPLLRKFVPVPCRRRRAEPSDLQGVREVEPAGIEPATSCLQSRRSPN
jgi:hypothetical protein